MDYSRFIDNAGTAIDASRLLANIDTAKMLANLGSTIDTANFLASIDSTKLIDTTKVFANIDLATLMADIDTAKMLANIDTSNLLTTIDTSKLLAGIDTAKLFANIDTAKIFSDAASVSQSAEVASAILQSEELADVVASADVTETDVVDEAPVIADIPADVLRAADPLGLITPHRELTQGEWSLLQLIASSVGVIALMSYHRTAEESAAASITRAAYAHARAADGEAAERMIAEAERLSTRESPPPPLSRNMPHDSEHDVRCWEARCWAEMAPAKAISLYEDVLRTWPRGEARDGGLLRACLALACADAGEHDRAQVEGRRALTIARATRSATAARELKRLGQTLSAN